MLVDDASNHTDISTTLPLYIKSRLPSKVLASPHNQTSTCMKMFTHMIKIHKIVLSGYHHHHHLHHHQVGLVRTPSQLGLIQARLAGARAATGSFIVFLDSHCEATKGWLEPMAQRMKEDPTVVQIPRSCI